MTEMVSPGVYLTEKDLSTVATNNSQCTTVFAGKFTKGPLEKYTQITNVDELISFYGKPNNSNYNDWFQCYNFLQYADNLLISRACNVNGAAENLDAAFLEFNSLEGWGIQEFGTSTYGITSDVSWAFVDKHVDVQTGDIVSFGNSEVDVVDSSYPKFKVLAYLEDTITRIIDQVDANGIVTQVQVREKIYAIKLDRAPTMIVDNREVTAVPNTPLFKIDIALNGSTEALDYESAQELQIDWKKTKKATYSIPFRIPEYLDRTAYYNPQKKTKTVEKEDINTGEWYSENYEIYEKNTPTVEDAGFLFKLNRQIKNDDHFSLIKDSLAFSNVSAKLKFFSKTPGTEDAKYRICICTPQDFAVNDTRFVGNHCTKYVCEGITIDGLFEYAPKLGSAQIAVVIYDPIELEIKETWLCSLDPKEVDAYNNSMYIEDIINRQSNLVYVKDNVSKDYSVQVEQYILDVYGNKIVKTTKDPNGNLVQVLDYLGNPVYRTQTVTVPNISSYCFIYDSINNQYYGRSLTLECASDSEIQEDDLMEAFEVFDNKEDIDVDIIIANELDNGRSALNLAETRQDCIAYCGIPLEYAGSNICVGQKASTATSNIVKFRNSVNYNSMWINLCANYKYQYDRYNDVYRWLNIAGDCAGLRAKCSTENDSWWAAAGLDRGQLKNVTKLAYAPNQTQRGTLYTNGINPVITFPGEGTVLWGQKTMLNRNSSFNRVNIRCLFNTIERTLARMSRYSVFEFNDAFTRNKVISTIKPYLAQVQAGRGITEFKVVCDTSNNTPQIIAENKLNVDIYIKPTYVAEFIHLTFINVGVNNFNVVVTE